MFENNGSHCLIKHIRNSDLLHRHMDHPILHTRSWHSAIIVKRLSLSQLTLLVHLGSRKYSAIQEKKIESQLELAWCRFTKSRILQLKRIDDEVVEAFRHSRTGFSHGRRIRSSVVRRIGIGEENIWGCSAALSLFPLHAIACSISWP